MDKKIKYYVPHVSFTVEWFRVNYKKDIEKQVKKMWDEKDHLTFETYHNDNLDTVLDMARYIILHSDYNYAAIFQGKYDDWGTDDQECTDYEFLGDVRVEEQLVS